MRENDIFFSDLLFGGISKNKQAEEDCLLPKCNIIDLSMDKNLLTNVLIVSFAAAKKLLPREYYLSQMVS